MNAKGSMRGALGLLLLVVSGSAAPAARAQTGANERVFPQSKVVVEKALRTLQSTVAGRLPSLEGFAQPGEHPLDRYDRAYYQATVEVTTNPAGGARVRVSVKVTAWYKDPVASHSGYQLITSNGRIESDILDQLAEQLASRPAANQPEVAASTKQPLPQELSAEKPAEEEPSISAPTPKFPQSASDFSSSLSQGLAAQAQNSLPPSSDKSDSTVRAEAASLEELLRNQAHPNNLVAVKKSGTPVVASPSLTAKPLFLASLHDEFEMLDYTADWVHVRISGLSRGWIWRNSLEMPEGIPDTDAPAAAALKSAQDLFHVTREETAQFPGDWAPLRGKNVKILSVQNTDEKAKETSSERLEFTKFLFERNFAQLTAKPQEVAGMVVIFDSVDGGMIAATVPTLQDWRAGTLSDSALWHKCFFDPPETFDSSGASVSQ